MRNLIIGGAGFVGRNLAQRLVELNEDVAILDKAADPRQGDSKLEVLFQGDAQDLDFLREALVTYRPHRVFHLAANSDIQSGISDASLDFGDTLMTTVALRSVLPGLGVESLVFASSSAIFGASDQPFSEASTVTARPISWYGKAKLASEYVLESLSTECPGMKLQIVRFPNVVGPLATHGVVYDFVRKLRANPDHLPVLGNGKQSKPYIHVHDLIDGILHFEDLNPGVLHRINIGPLDCTSVSEIAGIVTNVLELDPEISYEENEYGWVGDVPRYSFDTTEMERGGFRVRRSSSGAIRLAAEAISNESLC